MSAGINTEITLKGTTEELLDQIKAVKEYEISRQKEYEEKHDCAYIKTVRIKNSAGEELNEYSDDAIRAFIADGSGEIQIDADGPYGVFDALGETGLFEYIADASPTAGFTAKSSGYVTGAEVELTGELKEWEEPVDGWPARYLGLDEYYITDEAIPELYGEKVKEVLPYSEFCATFKIDADEFSEYEYNYFIEEAFEEESFPDMEYDDFIECCEAAGVDEEEYEEAVERLSGLELVDYDTFREEFDYTYFLERSFYNPVTKEKITFEK